VCEDQGEYKCVIRNAIGEAITVCNLTINPKEEALPQATVSIDELMQKRVQRPSERPTAPRRRYDLVPDFDEVFEPSKTPRLSESIMTREAVFARQIDKRESIPTYSETKAISDTRRAISVPPREFTVLVRQVQTLYRDSTPQDRLPKKKSKYRVLPFA
jgi:hypothetical protein